MTESSASLLPLWMILAGVSAAGVWASWLAWRRPNRGWRSFRLAAVWTALLALALLASPPACRVAAPAVEAILVTPGATLQQVRDFQSRQPQGLEVFRLSEDLDVAESLRGAASTEVAGTGLLARNHPEVAALHILGHGLREDQLEDLADRKIIPHLTPVALGISWLDAPQQLSRGREFRVEGRLVGLPDGELTLKLADPGGNTVSEAVVTAAEAPDIGASREASFSLRLTTKVEGPQLYRLALADGEETLLEEVLPVFVTPPIQLDILILQSSPSFEFRHLENWLSEQGHAVAVRSQVSRGRYRREFLNREPLALNRFAVRDWTQFDLVIADFGNLSSLDPSERAELRQAVSDHGLGVLIVPERGLPEVQRTSFSDRDYFFDFQIESYAAVDRVSIEPAISGPDAANKLPAHPWELAPDEVLPLLHDRQGRVLAAAVLRREGRVGLSLLTETYVWRLEGLTSAYSTLWTSLLDSLVSSSDRQFLLPRHPQAFPDLPFELQVRSKAIPVAAIVQAPSGQSARLTWLQDPLDATRWRSTFWPREPGWHVLKVEGSDLAQVYVHTPEEWSTLRASRRSLITRQAASLPRAGSAEIARDITQLFPRWVLLLLFLAVVGGLWAERLHSETTRGG